MPKGSSAVRPTNGLYLFYLFTLPFRISWLGNDTVFSSSLDIHVCNGLLTSCSQNMFIHFSQSPPRCMIEELNGSSVALVNQHARRMRHIVLSSVACLAVPCFSTFSHNATIFENTLLKIKFLFWFSLQFLSETFLTLRRIQ